MNFASNEKNANALALKPDTGENVKIKCADHSYQSVRARSAIVNEQRSETISKLLLARRTFQETNIVTKTVVDVAHMHRASREDTEKEKSTAWDFAIENRVPRHRVR